MNESSAQRGQIDPRGAEEVVRIDRAGMWRVEDDRRPPLGRLQDLERRPLFAIKLRHRWAPFLKSAIPKNRSIRPENRGFCELASSVIAAILPSEKSLKADWNIS
jgi:hypothetical protein